MKSDPVDPARRVAIVLLSLEQGAAAELLGRLPREMVERVTLAIANSEAVTREQQESVLNDFKLAFDSRPLMQPTGPETARQLLERTLEQSDVEPTQPPLEEQIRSGPFAFLHHRHADDIRMMIEAEHTQTITMIVAQLPPGLSAQVLAGFEPSRQAEILGRLAVIGPADADTLEEISLLMQNRIGKQPIRAGGIVRTADVLRETAKATSKTVFKLIDQKDAQLANSLRESLFSFQDLGGLNDETLAIILQETGPSQWAIALKGCSEKLRQRVLRQVPAAVAKTLNTEMSSVGPLRLSEIASVQRAIAAVVLALEAEGRIDLPTQESSPLKSRDRLRQAN